MEFSVKDRLILLNVIPVSGSLTTLRLIRETREELGFSEEDHATLNLRREGTTYRWDDEAEAKFGTKDREIGAIIRGEILGSLGQLDEEGRLELVQLDVYERFMAAEAEALAEANANVEAMLEDPQAPAVSR